MVSNNLDKSFLTEGITLPSAVWSFVGGILIALMFSYLVFSFVLIRRVKIMNTNFKTPYAKVFSTLTGINFILTLVVIALTLQAIVK